MSFSDLKPTIQSSMDGLGYVEWPDAFDFNNIPETIRDKSYHIEFGEIIGGSSNHQVHEFLFPIVLRVFLEGYRDISSARDDALVQVESIFGSILDPNNRLGECIKDIIPDSVLINSASESNKNDIIIQIGLSAKIFYKY
jgi:hypothetical protein